MAQRLIELVDSGRIADEAALKRAFRRLAKRIHPDVAAGINMAGPAAPPRKKGDVAVTDGASRAFIALRAEYEEALAGLAAKRLGAIGVAGLKDTASHAGAAGAARAPSAAKAPPPQRVNTNPEAPRPGAAPRPRTYSARAFYESLEDLLGRGFPAEPATAAARGAYIASREEFLGLLAGRDLFLPPGDAVGAFLAFEAGLSSIIEASKPNRPMEGRFAYYLRNLVANILYYHRSGSTQPLRYARNEWPRLGKELRARGETRPLAFLALLMADLEAGPCCLDEEAGRGP